MYCTECGTQNQDTFKFCIACGHPLRGRGAEPVESQPEPVEATPPSKAMTLGNRIAGAAVTIAVIGFFLPWVTVSCGIVSLLAFLDWNTGFSFRPSWSPDGQRLVFVSDHGVGIQWTGSPIFVIEANGADRHMLADSDRWNSHVAWSPDGKYVAFGAWHEICIVDADGTDVRCVSKQMNMEHDFSWSPDGQEIAYSGRPTWDANSSVVYALDIESGLHRPLTRGQTDDYLPDWSPNGQYIVYVCARDTSEHICVIDANADSPEHPVHETGCGRHNNNPAWSPDGEYFAFGSRGGLCVVDTGSYIPDRIENTQSAVLPAWSPDGNQIAFLSGTDQQIHIVDRDGTTHRRLLADASRWYRPAWSPDGEQIAFVSNRTGNSEIYIIGADGSNLRRLTHSRRISWLPAWAWVWW